MFITEQVEVTQFRIVRGAEYVFISDVPTGCKGHRYRVLRFLKSVPSYQQQVLVECLSGPDRGLWFTCSLANFATRYKPASEVSA